MPCRSEWKDTWANGGPTRIRVCLDHPGQVVFGEQCHTGKHLAMVAALPRCVGCGEPVCQARSSGRARADGSQSWRHHRSFKVRGPDGHKAAPVGILVESAGRS